MQFMKFYYRHTRFPIWKEVSKDVYEIIKYGVTHRFFIYIICLRKQYIFILPGDTN